MSGKYRLLIALLNLVLLLGIGWVLFRIFVGSPGPPMPRDWKPLQFAIQNEGQARSGLSQHGVTWTQIDRAKPPPPPVAAVEVPQRPASPRDLSSIYELVFCMVDPSGDPKRASCVVRDRRGGEGGAQRSVGVGDDLDGYKVLEIAITGEKDNRVAEVTVDDRGTQSKISLRRVTQ